MFRESSDLKIMDFFQALNSYLERNPDPDLLVMGNGLWSIYNKPDPKLSLEEYHVGLKRLVKVLKHYVLIYWLQS
jgi:hypothetical protein